MHKLVELVHHSLQEGPVIDQKVRELADDVHDITCDECLRIFCRAFLAEIQKLFDHGTQELILAFNIHAT